MIDLHAHIIPGIDDGARDMPEAMEMAEAAVSGGTTIMAATSHGDFSVCKPEEYLHEYKEGFRALKSRLKRRGIPLKLVPGMELLINDSLLHYAKEHPLPTLNRSGYVLTEVYFDTSFGQTLKWLDELLAMGYNPVLAHPERYDFAGQEPERLWQIFDRGVILQVNKGSLTGEFGGRAYRAADKMLTWGIAGAIGSDTHDPVLRTPDMSRTEELVELRYGMDAGRVLFREGPRRILRSRIPF